jgi:hypothetical protein
MMTMQALAAFLLWRADAGDWIELLLFIICLNWSRSLGLVQGILPGASAWNNGKETEAMRVRGCEDPGTNTSQL